jgi:hypothetical protein
MKNGSADEPHHQQENVVHNFGKLIPVDFDQLFKEHDDQDCLTSVADATMHKDVEPFLFNDLSLFHMV